MLAELNHQSHHHHHLNHDHHHNHHHHDGDHSPTYGSLKLIFSNYVPKIEANKNISLIQSLGFPNFNPKDPREFLEAVLLKEDGTTHFEPEALKFLFPEVFGLTDEQVINFLKNSQTQAPENPDQCCEIKGRFYGKELSLHLHGPYHGENKKALLALALAGFQTAREMLAKLTEREEELRQLSDDDRIMTLYQITSKRLKETEGTHHHNEDHHHQETGFSNWSERFKAIFESLKNLINPENQKAQSIFLQEIAGKGFLGKIDRNPIVNLQISQENKKLTDEFIKNLAQFRQKNPNLDPKKLALLLTQIHNPSIEVLGFNQNLATKDDLIKVLSQAVEILTRPNIEKLTPDEIKILNLAKKINEEYSIYYINLTTDHQGAYHFLETKDANGNLVKVDMCPHHTKESDQKLKKTFNSINQIVSKNEKNLNPKQFLKEPTISLYPPPIFKISDAIPQPSPEKPDRSDQRYPAMNVSVETIGDRLLNNKKSQDIEKSEKKAEKEKPKNISSSNREIRKEKPNSSKKNPDEIRQTKVAISLPNTDKPKKKQETNQLVEDNDNPIPSIDNRGSMVSPLIKLSIRQTSIIKQIKPTKSKIPIDGENQPYTKTIQKKRIEEPEKLIKKDLSTSYASSSLTKKKLDKLRLNKDKESIIRRMEPYKEENKEISVGSRLRKILSFGQSTYSNQILSRQYQIERKDFQIEVKNSKEEVKTTSLTLGVSQELAACKSKGTYEKRQINGGKKNYLNKKREITLGGKTYNEKDNIRQNPISLQLRYKRSAQRLNKSQQASLALSLNDNFFLPVDPYGAKMIIMGFLNS